MHAEVDLMSGMIMMVRVRVGMDLRRKIANLKRHVERGRTEISGKSMTEIGRMNENENIDDLMSVQSETKCVVLVVVLLVVNVFCRLSVGLQWMIENETGDSSAMIKAYKIETLILSNLVLIQPHSC